MIPAYKLFAKVLHFSELKKTKPIANENDHAPHYLFDNFREISYIIFSGN